MPGSDDAALAPYGWAARHDVVGPGLVPGRVVRVERTEAEVVTAAGQVRCAVEGALATGDWVTLDPEGRITEVLPRATALTRVDPSGSGVQVLAANVDVVLVTAPADRLSPARVERELAVAWDSGARPVVAVTKGDVEGAATVIADLRQRIATAEVIAVSARTGEGLEEVRALLRPALSAVLLGPSGAGKSTLTNALLGQEAQATGAVRDGDMRGRHTTSNRQLLLVPGGGVVIDTPGLRSIGLAEGLSLAEVFPDVETLAASCRFSDCAHRSEPGCAIRAALADGRLDPDRWASWVKLSAEVAGDDGADPVARREAVRLGKQRTREAKARRRT